MISQSVMDQIFPNTSWRIAFCCTKTPAPLNFYSGVFSVTFTIQSSPVPLYPPFLSSNRRWIFRFNGQPFPERKSNSKRDFDRHEITFLWKGPVADLIFNKNPGAFKNIFAFVAEKTP